MVLVRRVVCGARTHVTSNIIIKGGSQGGLTPRIHGFGTLRPCIANITSAPTSPIASNDLAIHLRTRDPRHVATWAAGALRAATRFRPRCSLVDTHPAPRAAARNLLRLSRSRPRAMAAFLGSGASQNTPSAQASAQASARASAATPAVQAAARAFPRAFARAPATAAASFLAATAVALSAAFATFIS